MEKIDIKNLNNYLITKNGEIYSENLNKFLSPYDNGIGYLAIKLRYNDGRRKQFYIHRLVADTYIKSANKELDINHIDGNKKNNCINNLEYCSKSENSKHAFKNKLLSGFVKKFYK